MEYWWPFIITDNEQKVLKIIYINIVPKSFKYGFLLILIN